jgi:hypothetical protein
VKQIGDMKREKNAGQRGQRGEVEKCERVGRRPPCRALAGHVALQWLSVCCTRKTFGLRTWCGVARARRIHESQQHPASSVCVCPDRPVLVSSFEPHLF